MINVKESLNEIYLKAEVQVKKLADTYRTEVLIPACKLAKMEFVAGNGNFDLITKKGHPAPRQIMIESDCIEQNKEYLIPIIQDLNECVLNTISIFAYYIEDVDKKDLK